MFPKLKFGEHAFLLLSGKIGISYKGKNPPVLKKVQTIFSAFTTTDSVMNFS